MIRVMVTACLLLEQEKQLQGVGLQKLTSRLLVSSRFIGVHGPQGDPAVSLWPG